jgi:hypothetical protein
MAKAIASLNFPDSLKLSLSLDLATIAENQVAKALSMLNEFSNPHFALKISEVDDEFILSATVVVSGEPKNYQLAIGIAINDVLSVSDSLLASFAKLKGTESLMNY